MVRTYDAQSSIDLPPFVGRSAATMGQQLLSMAAAEKKLAPNVEEARAGLDQQTQELEAAVRTAAAGGAEAVVQPARQAEAASWSGLELWLSGYMKMDMESPSGAIAARMHAALFGDGLMFLRLPTLAQWQETERRLRLLETKSLAADCAALGGQVIVATIQKRHAATGEAAGITTARRLAPNAPTQLQALDAFKAALRCYIAQLMANGALDRSGKASALAARLLEPLTSYQPTARSRAEKAPPPAADPVTSPNNT